MAYTSLIFELDTMNKTVRDEINMFTNVLIAYGIFSNAKAFS